MSLENSKVIPRNTGSCDKKWQYTIYFTYSYGGRGHSFGMAFELLCRKVFAPWDLTQLKGELLLTSFITYNKDSAQVSLQQDWKWSFLWIFKTNIKLLKWKLLDESENKQSIDLHECSEWTWPHMKFCSKMTGYRNDACCLK